MIWEIPCVIHIEGRMWSRCEALSLHRNSALASQDCFYLQKAGYFFWCKSYLAVFLCTIIRVLTTSTGLLAMQAESPAKKLKMIIRRGKSSKSLRHWRWVQKSRKAHLAAKWQPAPSLTPCASNWAFEASYTGSCNNNVNTPTRRAPPRRVTNQHKMRTTLKTWTPATRAARCAVGSPPRHKPRTPSCLREQFPSHQSSCQWQNQPMSQFLTLSTWYPTTCGWLSPQRGGTKISLLPCGCSHSAFSPEFKKI